MLPNMQGLVEDVMCFSQGGVIFSGGDSAYQCNYYWFLSLYHVLINH